MNGSEKQIKWATEIVLAKNAEELKNKISQFAADEKKSNSSFSDEERIEFNIISDERLVAAQEECHGAIDEIMTIDEANFWIDNRDYKLGAIVIKKFTHTNPFKPAPAKIISEDAKWLMECCL